MAPVPWFQVKAKPATAEVQEGLLAPKEMAKGLPELVKAILIDPFRGFANPRAVTSSGNKLPGAQ